MSNAAEKLDDERWNKAQRLAVAAAVAPHLRSTSERTRQRRVARVDKDGNVVGYTTLAEVQEAILRRHAIEIEVTEGTRPAEVFCEFCGKPVDVPAKGKVPVACTRKGGCFAQKTCAGFGEKKCKVKPGKHAFKVEKIRRRNGGPWRCPKCAVGQKFIDDPDYRRRGAEALRKQHQDPEWRAKQAEKQRRVMADPEYKARLSESLKKTFTPERRARQAELARKAMQDPERRAKAIQDMHSGQRTREERSQTSREFQARRSAEERRASARKAVAKRQSKRATESNSPAQGESE